MILWWIETTLSALLVVTTLMVFILVYLALFFKVNWVRYPKHQSSAKYFIAKNRKRGTLPPVYPNGWFALLESSELKRGEVKHITAIGENFAVFRTETGIVNILDAYCPHLGANMGEGGVVKGECLECPFHSWIFRGDGHCQSIPYAEKVPPNAKVKAWKSCEVNQLIFVWYHAESEKPSWKPQSIEEISNGSWKYQGRNEFYVNSHIQDIPENGADQAHLSAVHGPAMFLQDFFPNLARHSWTEAVWIACKKECKTEEGITSTSTSLPNVAAEKENTETNDRHKAILRLKHSLVLFEKYKILQLSVEAVQIGPGYVELRLGSRWGPLCILQTVTPVEPLLQRITHLMFSSRFLGLYAKVVMIGETVMFERDLQVWNNKTFAKTPVLVKQDRTILDYRRWFSQFYSANSPTFQSASESLSW